MKSSSYVSLPKGLKAKRGCLNIQNNDEKCFLWSIMLHRVQLRNHQFRVLKYKEYERELNISGIQYPVDIKDISKFEHQNNISVNLCGYEDKKNLPVAYYHRDHCLTSREFIIYHCWQNIILVKDVNRLVLRQYNTESNKRYFCQNCLHGCSSEEVLKNHLERCKLHGAQRIKFPEADDKKERDKVKFKKPNTN